MDSQLLNGISAIFHIKITQILNFLDDLVRNLSQNLSIFKVLFLFEFEDSVMQKVLLLKKDLDFLLQTDLTQAQQNLEFYFNAKIHTQFNSLTQSNLKKDLIIDQNL